MDATSSRWHEITPSAFEHERRALDVVRGLLPDRSPYQAWSNFTFTSNNGLIREVDLLLVTPSGVHLVEIKNLHGRLTNRGQVWLLNGGSSRPPFDNPSHLANTKAKELAGLLKQEALRDRRVRRVPFVREAVFLAEPDMVCALDDRFRIGLVGPGRGRNDLPSIDDQLISAAPRDERDVPDDDFVRHVPTLLRRIGIEPNRRSVTVGDWELERPPMETGPTWQDFHASRSDLPGEHRRIRIYLFQRQSTPEARASVEHAAQGEYAAARGIGHPGLLVPTDKVQHELGPALIIDQRRDAQRLDHWVAERHTELALPARLALVRQLAEAVKYAHDHRLVHRALSPRAIVVEDTGTGPRLRIGEWQVAARGLSSRRTAHRVEPTSHAGNHVEAAAQGYIAPEFTNVADGTVALDVFGVGAVAHLVLTGRPPCSTRQELYERLAREDGFRPTVDDPELPPAIDDLVGTATAPRVSARHSDLDEFVAVLGEIESAVATTSSAQADPLDARPGDDLPGGYRVTRVLGSGATSSGFLVDRHGLPSVLKVGHTADADERLEAEAITLNDLTHDHVVVLKQGMFPLGRRSAIELSYAGERTLAQVLAAEGALDPNTLERLGTQLLDAVAYIQGRETLHRDIKPDNLGVHLHPRRGLHLTLFDFSLAEVSTKDVLTGTFGYRDPHLGGADRPEYDGAADLYSVAATLHEMASGEVPVWGDDGTDARFVDAVTLSSDRFDLSIHDGLVGFFTTGLHRDARRRHESATAMRAAWHAVFHGAPLSTPDTPRPAGQATARLAVHVDVVAELRRLGPAVRDGVVDAVRSFPGRVPALVVPAGAADPWMRTLTLTSAHTGVVLAPERGDRYLLLRVLPHGDAEAWAKKHAATVNGVSGGFELRDAVELDRLEAELEAAAHYAPALLFEGVADADLERLGVDEKVRSMARTLADEGTLRTLQPFLPEEQFSVLLALASGKTADEVWTDLVAPRAADGAVDGADRDTAIDRTQGKLLRIDDVELADYLERPIAAWRTFLHSSQERIAYRPTFWGSAQVTGGPGTGKTVAALHRVKFLAQRKPLPPQSVLLTTFTNALEAALQRDLRQMDLAPDELEAVQVVNIDAWIRGIVSGAAGTVSYVKDGDSRRRWTRAAERAGVAESPTFLDAEWNNVVLAQGIGTEEEYLACTRHGRGRPVRQADRRPLWHAMSLYAQGLAADGLWTYTSAAEQAARLLAERETAPFQHVVVDEVQDLHPSKLRVIRAATRRGPDDIFLTGDPHQRIYSNRVSLKQVGITVASRSYKLKINYRTSAEILDWALGVLGEGEHEGFDGVRDSLAEYRASFHGQPPTLAGSRSAADEDAGLVDAVTTWHRQGIAWDDIAVAARTNALADRARSALNGAGIATRGMRDDADASGVVCATMHGMKGLEFRAVALVGVGRDTVPNKHAVTSESQDPTQHEQDLQQERNLLFVAATRPREQLRVSWTGEPSRFLPRA